MKTLRLTLTDLELGPLGDTHRVTGEAWARYTREVRTADGRLVVLAQSRKTIPATGVVEWQVLPNDDPTVHPDDAGFGIEVGWDLYLIKAAPPGRGALNPDRVHVTGSRTIVVTSADDPVVPFGLKSPAVPPPPPLVSVDQVLDQANAAQAAAQDAADSAAASAALVGAPPKAAMDAAMGGDVAGLGVTSDSVRYLDGAIAAAGDGKAWGRAFKTLASIVALDSSKVVVVAKGDYTITANTTISARLTMMPGARFIVNTGAKLTFASPITADPLQTVFVDGGGSVDLGPGTYEVGWFESGTNTFNARWSFASRGMTTFVKKTIHVPIPYAGMAGTSTSGTRVYWNVDAPIVIADPQNASTWYVEGEFKVTATTSAFMYIGSAAKPENVYFYGEVNVYIPAGTSCAVGIDIQGAARVHFYGEVTINGAATGIRCGSSAQVAPVGSIRFMQVQVSFFSVCAVLFYGRAGMTTQDIQIDTISATAAQVAGLNTVEIKGLIRNIRVESVTYSTDTPKDGYAAVIAATVLYLESNAEGPIYKVNIGTIYQADANIALKVRRVTGGTNGFSDIQGVRVANVWSKYTGVAADLDYCGSTIIDRIENNGDVILGSNCYATDIRSRSGIRTITDSGPYTTINGLAKKTDGAGVAPSPAGIWAVGTLIRETTDGKVYLRVNNAAAAADFVVLN